MRKWIGFLLLLGSVACAGHVPANAAPESKTAIYADDAMKGVKKVQTLVAAGETAKLIPTDIAAQVMIVAEKIGKGGESLSRALTVYHHATELVAKRAALGEVYTTLDQLDADLKVLLAPLDASGEKSKYVDIVTDIVKAVWSIRVQLPAMGGA